MSMHQIALLQTALDLSQDVIFFVKDRTRQYRMANLGLARICGARDTASVIGRRTEDFFDRGYIAYCDDLDTQVRRGETLLDRFDFLHDAGGAPVWTLFSRSQVRFGGEDLILGVSRRLPMPEKLGRTYERLRQATQTLSDRIGEPPGMAALAGQCGCSVSQLNRDFLSVLSMTPAQYQAKIRTQRIREYVAADVPLAAIALNCGFSDQSALSRYFKRQTGTTLTAYRRASRNAPA